MTTEHDIDKFVFDLPRSTPSPQLPSHHNKLHDSDGGPVGVNALHSNDDTIIRREPGSKLSAPGPFAPKPWTRPETKPIFTEGFGSVGPVPHHISQMFFGTSPMTNSDYGSQFLTKERAYSAPTPPTQNVFNPKEWKPMMRPEELKRQNEDEIDIFGMDPIDSGDEDERTPEMEPLAYQKNQNYFSNSPGLFSQPSANPSINRSTSQLPTSNTPNLSSQNRLYGGGPRSNFPFFNSSAPSSTANSMVNSPVNSTVYKPTGLVPSHVNVNLSSPPSVVSNPLYPPSQPTQPSSLGTSQTDINRGGTAPPNPMISAFGEHPLGEHPSRTLFVRNINSNVEDDELIALFSQHGPIRSIYTQCKHRGFVMISYFDIRHAKNAMRHLQNRVLRRRKLDIHYSIPKENPSEKDQSQGTLVVFNLDVSVSTDDLKTIFGNYGEIKEIRETPNKKHHKFIEFYDIRDAEKAMKHLNKSEIKGKKIKIEHSRPGGARKIPNGVGGSSAILPFESTNLLYSASPANDDFSDSSQPIANEEYANLLSSTLSHLSLDPSATPYTPSTQTPPTTTMGTSTNMTNLAIGSDIRNGNGNGNGNGGMIGASPKMNPNVNSFFSAQSKVVSPSSSYSNINQGFQGYQSPPSDLIPNPLKTSPTFDTYPNPTPSYGSPQYTSNPPSIHVTSPQNSHQIVAPKPAPAHWLVRKLNSGNNSSLFKSYSLPTSTTQSPASLSPMGSRSPSPPPSMGSSGTLFPTSPNHHDVPSLSINPLHWNVNTRNYSNSDPPAPIWNTGPSSPRLAQSSFGSKSGDFGVNYDEIFSNGTGSPMSKTSSVPDTGFDQNNPNSSTAHVASRRRSSSASQDDKLKYVLDIAKVTSGEDDRTTLMIKNIPNKYTQKMLLNTVNETHKGTYDFFYLPIDFKNRCNVGYAFINFLSPKHIVSFYKEFHNKKWEKFNSEKVCELTYGRIQGKAALINHFQNSSLMCEDKKCRPIIFHRPNAGEQESFPMGSANLGTRRAKDKEKDGSNNNSVSSPPSPHNQTS